MVRLKLNGFITRVVSPVWSQFHYGSIKTYVIRINSKNEYESQFHYGSIKTFRFMYINKQKIKSQFHYGSIKTE